MNDDHTFVTRVAKERKKIGKGMPGGIVLEDTSPIDKPLMTEPTTRWPQEHRVPHLVIHAADRATSRLFMDLLLFP